MAISNTTSSQNAQSTSGNATPQAIILAAGKGKRMGGDPNRPLPKVVYPVADRSLVWWVVDACRRAGVSRCIVVVGHLGEMVREVLAGVDNVEFVEQKEQLGTGHAAKMAQGLFDPQRPCDVFVLAGDAPLIRPQTLKTLLESHRREGAAATLATSVLDDPTGYGRIMRDAQGRFAGIVEQKDASPQQLAIREVNPSYYCFKSDELFSALDRVGNKNAQQEYYLTDVPLLLQQQGKKIGIVDAVPAEDILGINTQAELAVVDGMMRKRLGTQA